MQMTPLRAGVSAGRSAFPDTYAVTVLTSERVPKAVRKTIPKNKTTASLESESDTWQMVQVRRESGCGEE
jgi:hypothetical protein